MPGLLAAILPAIIGTGGGIAAGLLGGDSPGEDALASQAQNQERALEELLRSLSNLQGRASNIRAAEQFNLDSLGNIFDFSDLPGLDPEQSAFFASRAAPFEGLTSVAPQQNEFARLAALLGPLQGAAGGGAAGQLAGFENLQESQLASALGGAAGNISQSFALENLLSQLSAQSARSNLPALLAAMNSSNIFGGLDTSAGFNPPPTLPGF